MSKKIVEEGYDKAAENYLKKFRQGFDANNKKFLKKLVRLVPKNSRVLDLGCGAGVPVAKFLCKFYKITGIDISAKQIELAKKNVPDGDFVKMDMTEIDFPVNHFDAIVAFYAIIHVPKEEHKDLLKKLFNILRHGGYLLATMGAVELEKEEEIEEDWLGASMYWSHFGKEENIRMLKAIGFDILISKVIVEDDDGEERHLYILAQKPNK